MKIVRLAIETVDGQMTASAPLPDTLPRTL